MRMPFLGKERLLYSEELVDAELEEERRLRRDDEGGFFAGFDEGGRGGGVGMGGAVVPGALKLNLSAGRWVLFGVASGELW